jgi:hypothetical protein
MGQRIKLVFAAENKPIFHQIGWCSRGDKEVEWLLANPSLPPRYLGGYSGFRLAGIIF